MSEPRLEDLVERLERERLAADRLYNDALTALDRAIGSSPPLPRPPQAVDSSRLPDVNRHWNLLPAGPPAIDGSLKGRLRGFVWRLIGPPLETQQQFNAALVDHSESQHSRGRGAAAHPQQVARGRASGIRCAHEVSVAPRPVSPDDHRVRGQQGSQPWRHRPAPAVRAGRAAPACAEAGGRGSPRR